MGEEDPLKPMYHLNQEDTMSYILFSYGLQDIFLIIDSKVCNQTILKKITNCMCGAGDCTQSEYYVMKWVYALNGTQNSRFNITTKCNHIRGGQITFWTTMNSTVFA